MRKNEHPSCGCTQCRRGIRSDAGHLIRQTNKRIRRAYKQALRKADDVAQIIVGTPYTD